MSVHPQLITAETLNLDLQLLHPLPLPQTIKLSNLDFANIWKSIIIYALLWPRYIPSALPA